MFNNSNGYSLADIAAATREGGDGFGGGWGSGWWIILLFLFAFGGWGNGFGGWGGGNGTAGVAYDFDISDLKSSIAANGSSIADGFYALNTGLLNGVSEVRHDICDQALATYQGVTNVLQAINADTMANMQNTFGLTAQLNNLGASIIAQGNDNRSLLSQEMCRLGYNLATEECATRQTSTDNTRAIIDNQNANTRSIIDFLTQDRISALQNENAALKGQISQAEQNAFLVNALRPQPDPAYLVPNPYASYGTYGYGCGCNS